MCVTGVKSEIEGNEKEWKGCAVVATTLCREHFYEVSEAETSVTRRCEATNDRRHTVAEMGGDVLVCVLATNNGRSEDGVGGCKTGCDGKGGEEGEAGDEYEDETRRDKPALVACSG